MYNVLFVKELNEHVNLAVNERLSVMAHSHVMFVQATGTSAPLHQTRKDRRREPKVMDIQKKLEPPLLRCSTANIPEVLRHRV